MAAAVTLIGLSAAPAADPSAGPTTPFRIEVVDADSGWPVPLVELTTTHRMRFVTDNAGLIAMDDPSLMNREIWFEIQGHGYGVDADGFGNSGKRLTPRPGGSVTISVNRRCVAKRIGRLTGAGLFAESQKLGEESDWTDSGVFGCDSVQNAVYRDKMFWAWGDTNFGRYPLGVFHMTSATTGVRPFDSLRPPLRPRFDYFRDTDGTICGVAKMPGPGPTWLTGYVALPDRQGEEHLVAFYRKIRPPLTTVEAGLCTWNDQRERFELRTRLWKESDDAAPPTLITDGHPAFWTDPQGRRWLYFGNPLPRVRLPATFEAWQDPSGWEVLSPQTSLVDAETGAPVEPHSGSIAWNEFRGRWVTIFMQKFGKPSAFGTLWYAESDSPIGPWGPAVKILSHQNYTFYNPRLHPEFTEPGSAVLLFEGTYTAEFADSPAPTPRYNYNQILYRLDLDDPALGAAR